LNTASEINAVSLLVSRYESLAASDYHLCYIPPVPQKLKPKTPSSRLSNVLNSPPASTAEAGYGGALWAAGLNATTLFSSGASMMSRRDSFSTETARSTPTSSLKGFAASVLNKGKLGMAGREEVPGWKIYIASPYDCVFATERGKKDKLTWLLEKKNFAAAWTLIDEHPDIVTDNDQMEEEDESDDASTIAGSFNSSRNLYSASEKEKRRIGEYWIDSLINDQKWEEAGEICGKVLGTSSRWEHWIWVFFGANKVKEITPYIPTRTFRPPLPSLIYEYVLKEYLNTNRKRFEELINMWPEGLYDENAVVIAIQDKLRTRGEPELEKGKKDWRRLHECLAILYMRTDQHKNALLEQILLKNADSAIGLVRAYKLLDGIQGCIRDWILLRMSDKTFKIGSREDWERETQETIDLLVDESYEHEGRGLSIHDVVTELQNSEDNQQLLFFYLREIWNRDQNGNFGGTSGRVRVIDFDDLMVELFAEYDRPLLMQFLKTSQNYSYEKASQICEARNYIPELVHLLSTTGQTKRALNLITDQLNNVAMAIDFAKTQDDPDLWNDLLNYSMNKPAFIRGLLENVGTAIDPIKLIKRIPEGLEIEGLKDGCARILREYEIQYSISEGVAKVFRGEVAQGMERLRSGRRKGVKFDVHAELQKLPSIGSAIKDDGGTTKSRANMAPKDKKNGCGICSLLFKKDEEPTLIAFACGHVFHLGCLLRHSKSKIKPIDVNDAGTPLDEMDEVEALLLKKRRQSSAGEAEGLDTLAMSGSSGFRASVAEKVTRAALIKERVKGGCPLETRDD